MVVMLLSVSQANKTTVDSFSHHLNVSIVGKNIQLVSVPKEAST